MSNTPAAVPGAAARPAPAAAPVWQRFSLGWILPALALGLWQLAGGEDGSLFQGIVPTPGRVISAWNVWAFGPEGMGLNPYSGTWWSNTVFSTQRVAQGFGLAIALGVPLGILIGWSRLTARLFDPSIQWLRPIPITAWLPFSIALFGIRDIGSIFLIFLGGFYPIVVNTTHGVRDTNLLLLRAARMMGARPATVLLKVVFPSALPSIFTGLRLGIGVAWTAVIVAEMIEIGRAHV